jgi:hypothetical protein
MSGDVLLNQDPAIALSLHLPMNGAWSAEMAVATDATYAVGDAVTLTVLDTDFAARVVRAAQYGDRLSLRLTGGAPDWGLAVGVKHYRNTTADQVIADAGVTLAASLNTSLPFWTRAPGTVGSTVQEVAQYLGLNWRVLPDGTVRVAAEDPELVDPQAVEISRDPARGLVELAPELGLVLPGSLVGSDTVGDVVYDLTPDGVRCRYQTEARATLRGSLERIIRWVTRNTIYLTTYSAQVIRQAADGTLDLLVDDLRLQSQGLQGVPIRHGLPGVTVEVPAGERVLLAFDGGDPAKPHAMLWHEGQVTKVRIGGEEPVALASLVSARLDLLQQTFDAHIHITTATVGLGPPGTIAPPTTPVGPLEPVASEVLETR